MDSVTLLYNHDSGILWINRCMTVVGNVPIANKDYPLHSKKKTLGKKHTLLLQSINVQNIQKIKPSYKYNHLLYGLGQ